MPIPPPETKIVDAWRIACDGGDLSSGHPRVWLSLDPETGSVECPYCDAKYVHEDHAGTAEDA